MNDVQLQAHASIGLAVLACQNLEVLFSICVRLVFKHQTASLLSEITPLAKNFSKPPMKELLKELRKYVDISQEFEGKLMDLIERRNTLVHRWGIEHGMPTDNGTFQKITVFSNELAKDADGLAKVLLWYIKEWMERFPEFRSQLAEEAILWSMVIPKELRELKVERAQ